MPPVMPYVNGLTGDASFYPPLRKKGRSERGVTLHRLLVDPSNTTEDVLRIANEHLPMDADNLATSIHKLAKLRRNEDCRREVVSEDPRWTRLIDEVMVNGTAFIWPMRLLSLVAWAASSVWDRRILPLLFDVAGKRVQIGAVPQDLSSIAWAVATSRMRDKSVHSLLALISVEAQPKISDFVPQDIAMCAWAFAKVVCRDNKLLRLFADESNSRVHELNGQNLSNVVWALATIREMHEPLMATMGDTRADTVQGLGPQEFSNIVWSFATLLKPCEKLFRRTAPRVVVTARDLDSQHLANIMWAYAKVSQRDDGLFHVLSREAMRGARQVNPLNLANFAWAFASAGWHGEMSTRRIGLRDPKFFEWIANAAVNTMQQFTPQNCSNLVWAFATMRVSDSNLFSTMAVHVQSWLMADFDPQHLSNVLWSYAKLAMRDRPLFEAASDEILKRGLDYLTAMPQNISNTIWAYGTVGIRVPALLRALEQHITTNEKYYQRLTEVRPLAKSNRAQLAMTVLSLHRLGLDSVAWYLFDRISADGLQAGGEAYCNWLLICGASQDMQREVQVFEQMARTAHTKGLKQACFNCAVLRSLACGDTQLACRHLQTMDEMELCNSMSEHLRERAGAPAPRSAVGLIDWRRREKEEHEWVTNSLGFSLRLNKIEYYKEVGTLHYILQSEKNNLKSIHANIEGFIREQDLWLKLAGDEKGAVLDACIAMHGAPRIIVEVGLYVGYSSTRMASQLRAWGGKVISIEVDPYHAAISRNTIELAGLSDFIEIWVGHSENLIPRLQERLPPNSIDMLFFDQQGTKMHLDLDRIIQMNMLSHNAIIVGDNVLRPGSPQFMFWTCTNGPYDTQVISLKEYAQDVVEDWMSISFYKAERAAACGPMAIPDSVEQLGHDTDGIRWQSVESKVSTEQWDCHSQRMRREFAKVGILPHEIRPWFDAEHKSRVTLRHRDSEEWEQVS